MNYSVHINCAPFPQAEGMGRAGGSTAGKDIYSAKRTSTDLNAWISCTIQEIWEERETIQTVSLRRLQEDAKKKKKKENPARNGDAAAAQSRERKKKSADICKDQDRQPA